MSPMYHYDTWDSLFFNLVLVGICTDNTLFSVLSMQIFTIFI